MVKNSTQEIVRQDVALADLSPHQQNYNRHSEDQIKRIARSLQTFGQIRSIVVWRMTSLAGHGVVEAAKSIGWPTLRADVLPDDFPEEKALGYLVADNELARQSDPDQIQLAGILQSLQAHDPMLVEASGYTQQELTQLLKLIQMPEFQEYDESVEDDVVWNECPECGHRWPK